MFSRWHQFNEEEVKDDIRTTRRTKRGGQQGWLNEKDNDNNQIIKYLTFLESQAQVHFNDDNEEEEHKNEKEEDEKDHN